jgi:hypothetical protein
VIDEVIVERTLTIEYWGTDGVGCSCRHHTGGALCAPLNCIGQKGVTQADRAVSLVPEI